MKTDKEIYDSASPEAKRRLALKLLEYKQVKSSDPRRELWKNEQGELQELFLFNIEESLDQCQLLIEKAKENCDIWSNLGSEIYKKFFNFEYQGVYGGCPAIEIDLGIYADILFMKADTILFLLFRSFEVMDKLRKEQNEN